MYFCLGVAHRNNKTAQNKIADGNAIAVLVGLMITPPSQEIQVRYEGYDATSVSCILKSLYS